MGDKRDFLRLGEGHDTKEFAQSCKQRALERVVLESLGLAEAQQPPSTRTEYRVQPADIPMDALQHTSVYIYGHLYQLGYTTYSARVMHSHQLHTNQYQLLLRTRHHMS